MRTTKDRLHRVLVIGATPAGLAATNKLGEMGIPVTLIDPDPDLNEKLAREEWRLSSGQLMNYALRPGLLRILRNPGIHCILPGEITSLKHTPQGFCARYRSAATFVDSNGCTLCGRCAEVCPATLPDGSKPVRFNGRQSLPGRPIIDKRREPLCQSNCPLGVNVQGYIALAAAGRFSEALELIRRDNVLPGICGRVCTHPCEAACRRSELDQPLAIRDIKRFVADRERAAPPLTPNPATPGRKERIAIVGSGPSGLAAAADLARLGYPVTVFEREKEPGGLLRYAIGPHRLPREVLDREIEYIERLGVRFKTSHSVDFSKDLSSLRDEFKAVVVCAGMWKDRKLGAPGEDLEGVSGCIETLARFYRGDVADPGENAAVIGDGNAALDLARYLVRTGTKTTIISWFPENLIPASASEVADAREEGVSIISSTRVVGFSGRKGKLQSLQCVPTQPGIPDEKGIPWPVPVPGAESFHLDFDRAFVAIGQTIHPGEYGNSIHVRRNGLIQVDAASGTNIPLVYAAGDAVRGPSTIVEAMASGRRAAFALHRRLTGEEGPARLTGRPENLDFPAITPDIPSIARVEMPERQPAARKDSFAEVALGFSEAQVLSEASRCLQCGVCSECFQCIDACVSADTIEHGEISEEAIEQAGVVIITDPKAAPAVKGDDVIRAYSSKTSKNDVSSLMLRGFAAAAGALLLLGGSSRGLKGHGLSFSPPAHQLSPELRLGVFVCRCNASFGWAPELDGYVAGLTERATVQHAEVLNSACTRDGCSSIIRTIREKGLTRLVLASCVCCPLDFICSACTDQRSRLKHALFHGTGISRAMVETCNLRGEALRFLKQDRTLAVDRFSGLIDRSIGRAGLLKALPAPARPYNFTTAVIMDSESTKKSALTLAEGGMEVFLFGTLDRPLADPLIHPNIHGFPGSSVKGLTGTVGNFHVSVDMNGARQTFQAGAVILGEHSRKRIPYTPTAELSPHPVESSMQKRGETGIPFYMPGATNIPGLFLANPPEINASERTKGTAAAILAATIMPRSPRQNKGYTVVVDEVRCRGCGRCFTVCPYQAVSFRRNALGGWHSVVDEALCKGCGNCIPVCPSNAADSPYRDRRYLEQMIEEILLV